MTSQVSVWREARRSLVIIVLVALVLGSCLVLFVYTLPHLQVRQVSAQRKYADCSRIDVTLAAAPRSSTLYDAPRRQTMSR